MYTGSSTYWSQHMLARGNWNAESTVETADHYLFSVQGPNSARIMERATRADLTGLKFNQWSNFSIDGTPVRILRTGITGELGYELHREGKANPRTFSPSR
jgi:vanillate/3-O-methylgallate O-demethylase